MVFVWTWTPPGRLSACCSHFTHFQNAVVLHGAAPWPFPAVVWILNALRGEERQTETPFPIMLLVASCFPDSCSASWVLWWTVRFWRGGSLSGRMFSCSPQTLMSLSLLNNAAVCGAGESFERALSISPWREADDLICSLNTEVQHLVLNPVSSDNCRQIHPVRHLNVRLASGTFCSDHFQLEGVSTAAVSSTTCCFHLYDFYRWGFCWRYFVFLSRPLGCLALARGVVTVTGGGHFTVS